MALVISPRRASGLISSLFEMQAVPLEAPIPMEVILSPDTQSAINYAAAGVGLLARGLTVYVSVHSMRLFVENFSWALLAWRRIFALGLLLALCMLYYNIRTWYQAMLVAMDWIAVAPVTLVFHPAYDILEWAVHSWGNFTKMPFAPEPFAIP